MDEDQDKASEKRPKRGKKERTKPAVAAGAAAAVGAAAGLTGSELIGQAGNEEHVAADPADFDSASYVTSGATGVSDTGSGFVPGGSGGGPDRPSSIGSTAQPAEGRPGAPADEGVGSGVQGHAAQAGGAAGQAADAAQDAAGRAGEWVQDGVDRAADMLGGLEETVRWGAGLAASPLDEGVIPGAIADVADAVAGEGGRRAVDLASDTTEIAADRAGDAVGDFASRLGADLEHGTREVIQDPGGALVDAWWAGNRALIEVHPGKPIKEVIEGMDEGAIPDAAGDAWSAAGDAAQYVGRTGADVVGTARDRAEHAIGEVEDAADDVGDAFSDAADAAGDAAEDAGEAIGDAAEDAGEAIGDAAEDTEEAFEDAGEALNPFD